jgi:hypothetical protein
MGITVENRGFTDAPSLNRLRHSNEVQMLSKQAGSRNAGENHIQEEGIWSMQRRRCGDLFRGTKRNKGGLKIDD